MTKAEFYEEYVGVAGSNIHFIRGGSGEPVVVLHSVEGNLGWLPYLDLIASRASVYLPTHPGYGKSERPHWLESVSDMAKLYIWLFGAMGLKKISLIGHFIGGWIAAEIAVMCPQILDRLILVDSAGIRPRSGEIADIFLLGEEESTRMSFYDSKLVPGYSDMFDRDLTVEERAVKLRNREMTTRLCWKPYMHDRSLKNLLPGVPVPTLVVWGEDDRIIPVDSGEQFSEVLPNASLKLISNCGHIPHLEKPDDLSNIVLRHLFQDK